MPVSDPLWDAVIRKNFLVIQIGTAPAYGLSLSGSSAATRPFLEACTVQQTVTPEAPGGVQPTPVGQVGGDYTCNEEGTLFSQQTNVPARLIFRNTLPTPVQLFWLDHQGRRQPYTSIGPGETGVQPTFFTHHWVVAEPSGRCLAIYYARRGDAEIVIGP